LLAVLARQGLPALLSVRISSGSDVYYEAHWRRPDGMASDNETLNRLREEVQARLEQYDQELAELYANRSDQRVYRLELAKRMHEQSARLEELARVYADALWNRALAALTLDVVQTVVEIGLTGGAATLARKSAEIASETATKAALMKRAAEASTAALAPIERSLIADVTRRGDALSDSLRRAVKFGREIVDELIEARIAELRQRGLDQSAALVRARIDYAPVLERLEALERRSVIANRLTNESAQLEREIAGFFGHLCAAAPANFHQGAGQCGRELRH
jgi:hypothetical protein